MDDFNSRAARVMAATFGGQHHWPKLKKRDMPQMKSVKLKRAHWEKARRIGGGNMAEGLRRALDAYLE